MLFVDDDKEKGGVPLAVDLVMARTKTIRPEAPAQSKGYRTEGAKLKKRGDRISA